MADSSDFSPSFQDYLSIGYLYLLALGIIRDVIYYGFLGVNIISYSSILDVLLSPLVFLTSSIKLFVTFILLIIFVIFFNRFMKVQGEKAARKRKEKGLPDPKSINPAAAQFVSGNYFSLFLICLTVFAMYLGAGLGGGTRAAERLEKGDLKVNHTLHFMDDSEIPVWLLGTNSQYVFYVEENAKQVSIAPIPGNIKKIDQMKE